MGRLGSGGRGCAGGVRWDDSGADGIGGGARAVGVAVGEIADRRAAAAADAGGGADEREELAAAARWVRGVLEERPGARVGVIVPGLEEQRAEIDRVFREVLAPELEDIACAEMTLRRMSFRWG